MENTKRIYKKSMAEFLMEHDCTFIKTVPDVLKPNRINWIFVNDKNLQEQMAIFSNYIKNS